MYINKCLGAKIYENKQGSKVWKQNKEQNSIEINERLSSSIIRCLLNEQTRIVKE